MNSDPIETCPYDPTHRISRSKMAVHLHKCKKNFPNSKKRQCPFDARHLVDPEEFDRHISTCPSREIVVHYTMTNNEQARLDQILPIYSQTTAATRENWDNDPADVRSNNPVNRR